MVKVLEHFIKLNFRRLLNVLSTQEPHHKHEPARRIHGDL